MLAKFCNEERQKKWERAFADGVLPVKIFEDFYELQVEALTPEQLEGVFAVMGELADVSGDEIRGDVENGIPILFDKVNLELLGLDTHIEQERATRPTANGEGSDVVEA